MLTKPLPGVRDDPFHPLSQGCVCHLLMNEGAGNLTYDISGHGNHGTLKNMLPNTQGSKWQGSRFGGGLAFDGDNDYVDCGNPSSLDIPDSISIAAWVRSDGDIHGRIASKHGGGSYGWLLARIADTDAVEWQISTTGSNWNGGSASANSFEIGVWYQITANYDGSYMRVYINGIEDTSGDFPVALSGSINIAPGPTLIGNDQFKPTEHEFDGIMDEVRIYNRALSTEEIKQLYHDPFCNLLQVPAWHGYSPVVVAALARSHGYVF